MPTMPHCVLLLHSWSAHEELTDPMTAYQSSRVRHPAMAPLGSRMVMFGCGNNNVVSESLMACCAGMPPNNTSGCCKNPCSVKLYVCNSSNACTSSSPSRMMRSTRETAAVSDASSSRNVGDSARKGYFITYVMLTHGMLW